MECDIVVPTVDDLARIQKSLCRESTGKYEPLHTEDRLRQVHNGLIGRIVNALSAKGITIDKEELHKCDDANVRLETLVKSSN